MAKTEEFQPALKVKVQRMLKNANMLLNLFNQVLDFRKVETDNLTLHLTQINLNGFIDNIHHQFKELADAKHIDFELNFAEESIICIADAQKLESILFNLLSNALKFTPDYGQIFLELSQSKEDISIRVKDTGIGISEKDLPSIFTRFYRTSTTTISQGAGIGLALVKKYVELLAGDIRVISAPNKGTEFCITIPKKENTTDFEPYKSSFEQTNPLHTMDDPTYEEKAKSKPTILVIDDNQDIRDYLKEILSTHYFITTASNGNDGLMLSTRKNPDLIICDIMMEGMDGLSVCEQIKSNLATSHIPVILLTAKNNLETQIEGFEKGADAYIEKPFSSDLLKTRIKTLINHRLLLKKKFTLLDTPTSAVSPTSVDEKFLQNVIAIIDKNMSDSDFTVQSLVDQLHIGQDQLYRKIKALTGLSINHFIRSIRLKKAAQLLKAKSYNVSEVMFQVGFNNPSYFSKCFKTEFGVLPSDYLSENKSS
jgi:DNA-binding response OmpR family regulator/two-component sensor histidine kinase